METALKLRAEVAEKEAEIYRQSQATLEEVREEQQECLTNHKEMTTVWSVKEKQRLNADRQRLERAKDHLRLDKEHMETENMELSKEILQQTEVFQSRKEELILERGTLQVREQLHINSVTLGLNFESSNDPANEIPSCVHSNEKYCITLSCGGVY